MCLASAQVEDMDVQLMFKRNNSLELIAKISDAVNKSWHLRFFIEESERSTVR